MAGILIFFFPERYFAVIESLFFKINDTSISDLNSMDIKGLRNWLSSVEQFLTKEQKIIAEPIIKEIKQRVELMYNLGLEYLSLDRPLRTLSGGEAQRIKLAKELSKRYSTYSVMDKRDRATAYCLPKYKKEGTGIQIYD